MIKGVAYCRYSPGHNQREESIEAQLRAIYDYADKNGITIIKEYIDRAQTGTADDRDAFKAMIRDSERKLFEIVLVHKVDRFSRNRYDSAIYKRKLRENGVKVIYVAQQISEGPEGAMMEAMLEGMAEYYSRNLAQEVMKGLKENAYECKFCGGRPPLGYYIDPATMKYVVNESEAEVVRKIYNLYLEGHGYLDICDILNNEGKTTKAGAKFGKNSIYEILRNEKYTGTYIYNRAAKKVNGKFNRHTVNKDSDVIKIVGGLPEIISGEAWEQVKLIMNSRVRSKHNRKPKEIYLLSGLLRCGICGSAMTTDTRHMKNRDKSYYYYRCYRNNGKNSCNLQVWSRDDLENMVLDEFEKRLFSGESLDRFAEKLYSHFSQEENALNDDISKFQNELVGINKKINNITEAIAEGGNFASLKDRLHSLETQKASMETEIAEAENMRKFNIPSIDFIKKHLAQYGSIRSVSREMQKTFLNEKIRLISVFSDHIDVAIDVNPTGCGRRI